MDDSETSRTLWSAVITAIQVSSRAGAGAKDSAPALPAGRSHRVDCALEAVEGPDLTLAGDGHEGACAVAAGVTRIHEFAPQVGARHRRCCWCSAARGQGLPSTLLSAAEGVKGDRQSWWCVTAPDAPIQ